MTRPINLTHDFKVEVSECPNRFTKMTFREVSYSEIVKAYSVPIVTGETMAEFANSKREDQLKIKDKGAKLFGLCDHGDRKKVISKSAAALDIDFPLPSTHEDVARVLYGKAYIIHSTHSSTPEKPRYRLIFPYDCSVTTDEHEAITRCVAGRIGIDIFDPTTFQPKRIMFNPSIPKDAVYFFRYQDGEPLNTAEVKASYNDWRDTSKWPVNSGVGTIIQREIKKQGDPLEKKHVVGAWCRTYDIPTVIEEILSDKYSACDVEDRYSLIGGSTSGGLVLHDEGKFAYSHHGSDPASCKLCNSFDLSRIHLFGWMDEKVKENTPSNKLPSYLAMLDFATKDPKVKKQLIIDRGQEAKEDFGGYSGREETQDEADKDWKVSMEVDRKGDYTSTNSNGLIISLEDKYMKRIALDKFANIKVVLGQLPWREQGDLKPLRDSDLDNIVIYFDQNYGISNESIINRVVRAAVDRRGFHPLREFLSSTVWDGKERVDSIFIDYLGAEDNPYTRAVTRISLVAAVARIFQPGVPYDQVVILVGGQGIGKSTVLRKLGKHWFSDNFAVRGTKEDIEQLLGRWIIEIGELVGIRSREASDIKRFISSPQDETRLAFGKEKSIFPRQCVFFGTTNETNFLTDSTGNRRFWPVKVEAKRRTKSPWEDLDDYQIDQIWAEAVQLYNEGEPLVLAKELVEFANSEQTSHTFRDERTGTIQEYLDKLLPENWATMDYFERRRFLDDDELQPKGTVQRQRVSISEIWCECFSENKVDLIPRNTRPLHDIMRHMEGWEESGKGPERVKNHGTQKCYIRKKIEAKKVSMIKNNSLTNSQN